MMNNDDMVLNCFRLKCAVWGEYFNNPQEFIAAATKEDRISERVAAVLASLSPREAKVLRMRFGIDMPTGLTLEEIGQQFDLTRERIRQIEAKALRKLRHRKRTPLWNGTV